MGQVVECAVLCERGDTASLNHLRHRLRDHDSIGLQSEEWPETLSTEALNALDWRLQRYDLAISPVAVAGLPLMRQRLALRAANADTPLLVLSDTLKAVAIDDLLRLGAHEFADMACSTDELLIRLRRCARRAARAPAPPASGDAGVQTVLRDGMAFSDAKQLLIHDFEQRYLHETLRAHQGNVSQAARTARKNRRAFWALMSRHSISAAPYRALVDAAPEGWGRPVQ